jgi:hypothetical protein
MVETDEQRKERERREAAKERASRARQVNLARRGAVARQEMISDLQRVSRISVGLGPSSSRARYREYGHFPEKLVTDVFGTHEEFRRASGLADSRQTRSLSRLIANTNHAAEFKDYADKHLLPWRGKHERKVTGEVRILVGSDFHSQYVDPFALACFLETAKDVQPDIIVLNGDVVEFSGAGRWSKRPGLNLALQSEIDFCRREILRACREACPDAQIDWVVGNHEDRLTRFLADTARPLAGLDCLQFEKLFSLDPLEVNLVFGDSFLATTVGEQREDVNRTWKVYGGCYVVAHHTPGGQNPGKKQLQRFGMSGTSGHTHKASLYAEPSLASPHRDWSVTGMMAGQIVGRSYRDMPSGWTNGFVLATVLPDKGVVFQEPASIKAGVCTIAGMRFDETVASEKFRRWQREHL